MLSFQNSATNWLKQTSKSRDQIINTMFYHAEEIGAAASCSLAVGHTIRRHWYWVQYPSVDHNVSPDLSIRDQPI